jgi:Leucine-rich repeat (LRR) protein
MYYQFEIQDNINKIKSRIDLDNNVLNIANLGLTLIPTEIFNDPELDGYFENLQNIYCYDNQLKFLPDAIGRCRELIGLYCGYNQLQCLPDSIGCFMKLRELYCNDNQLKSLPQSIGHCMALTDLYISHNQLQSLPESIIRNVEHLKYDKQVFNHSNRGI